MQNFSFIPKLGMTSKEFWSIVQKENDKYDMDKVLCYMYMMVKIAKEKNIRITREFLNECGKDITYFNGVTTWFDRINEYGKEKRIKVEHYIISCGNLEIIESCSIANKFTKLFACEFIYDEKGNAKWPKTAINYTGKTQYIYRIKKGVTSNNDDHDINEKMPVKRVRMDNMIYIGDGLTDVPSMLTVKDSGGNAIAVYPRGKRDRVTRYYEDGRVNYICEADYSKNSELEKIVKLIIDSTAIKNTLENKQKKYD